MKPESWEEVEETSILDLSVYSHVYNLRGTYDAISGATVRMSRENTSFQRALVEAGIIKEDVIKGRF